MIQLDTTAAGISVRWDGVGPSPLPPEFVGLRELTIPYELAGEVVRFAGTVRDNLPQADARRILGG